MVRFLVINDDRHLAIGFKDILEMDYVDSCVFTAFDGQTGLNLAFSYKPDLIMCNYMMPGISGRDVLYQLHQDEEMKLTPFLLDTAACKESIGWLEKDFGLNFNKNYLRLPTNAEDLLEKVRVLLEDFERKPVRHQKYEALKQYPIEEGGQRLFTSK